MPFHVEESRIVLASLEAVKSDESDHSELKAKRPMALESEESLSATPASTSDPASGVGARVVAWSALREAEKSPPGGAQELLGRLAQEARLDSRDRGLAFDMMQGVWRGRRLYDWILSNLEGFEKATIDPPTRDLLRIALHQYFAQSRIPVYAIVHETVELAGERLGKRAAGFCNALLRRLTRQYPNRAADLPERTRGLSADIRHSFPDWIVGMVKRAVGPENLDLALETLNRPLPLYARVNPTVATLEEACGMLSEQEPLVCRIRKDLAPLCVQIDGPAGPVTRSPLFRQGGLIVQDASSQRVAEFVGVAPGMAVVDLCAAPGGKAIALALSMECRGVLFACEVSEDRTRRLRQNLRRMQVDSFVWVRPLDDSSRGETFSAMVERLNGGAGADRVLVDAPCSGLGTLRRHPEIRWRLHKRDFARLAALQISLLNDAAELVRPGGRVVYSTCSLAAEENERVVERFIEERGGEFRIATDRTGLHRSVEKVVAPDGWLRCFPHRDETDSATAVRLERVSSR
ncbi:hypothetical protein JW916_03860 [Candidatus Sumerlaeota bacterium]|nr:hypothetical protein [Candidatus Sumerlaeota bacterium]